MYLLAQNPAYQALLFLLLTPALILALQPKSADTAWLIATCTFALFLLLNATMLWFAESPWRYFFISLGFAVGYLLITALTMKGVLSVLRLKSPEESAMAFLIVIYQPIALLLVMLVKWLVQRS